MSDKPQTSNKAATDRATPRTFGMMSSEFYADLQGRPVVIALMNGKTYGGDLIGVDQYDVLVRQASGLLLLIPKHAVALLHAAKNGGAQAS